MKRHILVPLLLLCSYGVLSQTTTPPPAKDDVHELAAVEQQPEFPGGEEALMRYVSAHVNYPQTALEAGIQGKVFVEFIVGKDGNVSDATVKRGASSDLDAEALRVVKSLPPFKPGMMNGDPVKVRYVLPIVFKLT